MDLLYPCNKGLDNTDLRSFSSSYYHINIQSSVCLVFFQCLSCVLVCAVSYRSHHVLHVIALSAMSQSSPHRLCLVYEIDFKMILQKVTEKSKTMANKPKACAFNHREKETNMHWDECRSPCTHVSTILYPGSLLLCVKAFHDGRIY